MHAPAGWWTGQPTGFLAAVSSAADGRTASRLAVERAAEALDAEVAALLLGGEVYVSIGFPSDPALEQALVDVADGPRVVMPRMSGRELAERLGIEPVFMSGYTDDVVLRHRVEGLRLVHEPFDAETPLTAVRSALDGAPA
jgi:hypothetical protein